MNSIGKRLVIVPGERGERWLEVWEFDLQLSSCYASGSETDAQAVEKALRELEDPDICFNTKWEEDFTREGMAWLAEQLGVKV